MTGIRLRLSDARIASLFLVALSSLAFELEIMRAFSAGSWSSFGSMVISIALLGFGVAGTLLTFLGDRVRKNPDFWLSFSALALGPSMALAHTLAQHVPFNPVLIASDSSQLWWIAAYYLLYSIPFFFCGLFIGAVFTALSSRLHTLYFWDMLGSGLGGLLILGLMFLFPPDRLIYPVVVLAMLPALLCCMRWDGVGQRFRLNGTAAAFFLAANTAAILGLAFFGGLSVSDFKGVSYARRFPDSERVYKSFSPQGQMEVYESSYFHFAPGLSDNAGVSLADKMPKDAFLGLYVDGNGPTGVMRKLTREESGYIDFLPMSAPYLLLQDPKVLLLRLGGGIGVNTALHNGAKDVTVVESNPDLVHMIRDVPFFQAFTGGILQDSRVKVESKEVRAFAGTTKERFDLVEIGLIDSYGLSQAGGYPIEENYVYTVEALREYLRCLAPSGMLTITVWDRLNSPRNVPKLLSTVVETLRRTGVAQPEKRIYSFNLLLSTATVIVKNSDFLPAEIGKLNDFCRRMSFQPIYHPGMPENPGDFDRILQRYTELFGTAAARQEARKEEAALKPSDLYHFSLEWMFQGKAEELYRKYVFNIRPATDDKPYYSGYVKPAQLPQMIGKIGEIPEEWGYLLLLGTLLQSILFGLLVLFLPITLRWRELFSGHKGTPKTIVYFACLGIGYMMAEIFLMQRFVYFLTDPVYANSIVIMVLLISSGVGSLVSGKFRAHRKPVVRIAIVGIVCFALFYLFGLSPVLKAMLGAPLVLKALIAVVIIAPFGVCLGVPFPSGLSEISEVRPGILPWAWGVNGALSVTGSVLTRLISTSVGFVWVLVGVMALYALAALTFPGRKGAAAPVAATAP